MNFEQNWTFKLIYHAKNKDSNFFVSFVPSFEKIYLDGLYHFYPEELCHHSMKTANFEIDIRRRDHFKLKKFFYNMKKKNNEQNTCIFLVAPLYMLPGQL